ncbi:hypothetical protein BKA93DRAFT_215225 [Sparassis latifolia]
MLDNFLLKHLFDPAHTTVCNYNGPSYFVYPEHCRTANLIGAASALGSHTVLKVRPWNIDTILVSAPPRVCHPVNTSRAIPLVGSLLELSEVPREVELAFVRDESVIVAWSCRPGTLLGLIYLVNRVAEDLLYHTLHSSRPRISIPPPFEQNHWSSLAECDVSDASISVNHSKLSHISNGRNQIHLCDLPKGTATCDASAHSAIGVRVADAECDNPFTSGFSSSDTVLLGACSTLEPEGPFLANAPCPFPFSIPAYASSSSSGSPSPLSTPSTSPSAPSIPSSSSSSSTPPLSSNYSLADATTASSQCPFATVSLADICPPPFYLSFQHVDEVPCDSPESDITPATCATPEAASTVIPSFQPGKPAKEPKPTPSSSGAASSSTTRLVKQLPRKVASRSTTSRAPAPPPKAPSPSKARVTRAARTSRAVANTSFAGPSASTSHSSTSSHTHTRAPAPSQPRKSPRVVGQKTKRDAEEEESSQEGDELDEDEAEDVDMDLNEDEYQAEDDDDDEGEDEDADDDDYCQTSRQAPAKRRKCTTSHEAPVKRPARGGRRKRAVAKGKSGTFHCALCHCEFTRSTDTKRHIQSCCKDSRSYPYKCGFLCPYPCAREVTVDEMNSKLKEAEQMKKTQENLTFFYQFSEKLDEDGNVKYVQQTCFLRQDACMRHMSSVHARDGLYKLGDKPEPLKSDLPVPDGWVL